MTEHDADASQENEGDSTNIAVIIWLLIQTNILRSLIQSFFF